jgi:hypothetical protein
VSCPSGNCKPEPKKAKSPGPEGKKK